jgi:hypothetical protein
MRKRPEKIFQSILSPEGATDEKQTSSALFGLNNLADPLHSISVGYPAIRIYSPDGLFNHFLIFHELQDKQAKSKVPIPTMRQPLGN